MERRLTQWGGIGNHPKILLPKTDTGQHEADQPSSKSWPHLLNDTPMQMTALMDKSPWQTHQKISSSKQGSKVYVASCRQSKAKSRKLVAIRKIDQCPKEALKALKVTKNEHIIKCDQAYYWEGSVYLIHELIRNAVTLGQVMVNPWGPLYAPEMAAICLGLLKGIKYIHEKLNMAHEDITKDTVLFTSEGQLKIANLAEKMLCVGNRSQRSDLVSVGVILSEMMQTSPDGDQEGAMDFKDKCSHQDQTAATLLNHRFLQQAQGPTIRVEYVYISDLVAVPSSVSVFGR